MLRPATEPLARIVPWHLLTELRSPAVYELCLDWAREGVLEKSLTFSLVCIQDLRPLQWDVWGLVLMRPWIYS